MMCMHYQYSNAQITDKEFATVDQAMAVIDSSRALYRNHEYEKMAAYLEAYYPLAYNDSLQVEFEYRMTMAYGHLAWFDKMFESIVNGIIHAQNIKDEWMLLAFYRELGSFHDDPLGDQKAGLKYMKMAIPYLGAVDSSSKCGLMMDIGLSYVNAGHLDSATYYYDRAFDFIAKDSTMVPDVYAFYTPFLLKSKKWDEAKFYLDYCYKTWKEIGYNQGLATTCVEYAEWHFQKGNYNEALAFAEEGEAIARDVQNIFLYTDALEWKAKSQEEKKMTIESLISYKTLNQLKDSIEVINQKQALVQKRLAFVVKDYEEELAQINNQTEQLSEQVNFSKRVIFLIAISLIIVISIAYWIHQQSKKKIGKLYDVISLTEDQATQLKADYNEAILELERNKRELTSSALFIEKKDETLKSVRKMLANINVKETNAAQAINTAKKMADRSLNLDSNWESFRYFFEQVYPSFFAMIKTDYPGLNKNELRSLSYIKMGLTDKEVSRLLGINTASFQKAKYRMKKKINLPKDLSIEDMLDRYDSN